MAFYAVTMVNGPAYDKSLGRREQAGWDAHAAFMDELAAAGFVVLGGPVGDGRQTMLAIQAADEETIRRQFSADPWNPMGILAIGEIRPWTIWLDGRRPSLAADPG